MAVLSLRIANLAALPLLAVAWYLAWAYGSGGDALVYYGVSAHPTYDASSLLTFSYQYPPIFAQAVQPLHLLPWPAFLGLLLIGELAALSWLVTPAGAVVLLLIQFPDLRVELLHGNVNLLVAAGIVVAVRHAGWWAPLTLTKVTPGLGLLWPLSRGEWRSALRVGGVMLSLAAISFALAPASWMDYAHYVLRGSGTAANLTDSLWPRLLLGAALVIVAARLSLPFFVPLALALASPIWPSLSLLYVLAVPRLAAQYRSQHADDRLGGRDGLRSGRRGKTDVLFQPGHVALDRSPFREGQR